MAKHDICTVRVAVEWYWKKSIFWQRLGPVPWLLGGLKQHYGKQFRTRCKKLGLASPDAFFGSMLAGRVDLRNITAFLDCTKSCRSAEICLHPADASENNKSTDGWHDPLAPGRPKELAMLKSQELYELLISRRATLGRMYSSRSA